MNAPYNKLVNDKGNGRIGVSVCMLAYNHEKFIEKSLDSILMQRVNFNFNIVIGEDFSTDATRSICLNYKNKYPGIIDLILREKNVGSMVNAIDTINNCNGRYIAYLEGDDYWIDENKLQMQYDFLEQNKDYGLVYTNYCYTFRDGTKIDRNYKKEMKSGYVFNDIVRGGFPRVLTMFYRKELLDRDFFNYVGDNNILTLDYPTILYLANKTKFKYLNKVTAQYNYNDTSMTKQNNFRLKLAYHKSGKYALTKFLSIFSVDKSYKEYAREFLNKRERITLYYCIKSRNKQDALESIDYMQQYKKSFILKVVRIIVVYKTGLELLIFLYNIKIFIGLTARIIFAIIKCDRTGIFLGYRNLKSTLLKFSERKVFNKNLNSLNF